MSLGETRGTIGERGGGDAAAKRKPWPESRLDLLNRERLDVVSPSRQCFHQLVGDLVEFTLMLHHLPGLLFFTLGSQTGDVAGDPVEIAVELLDLLIKARGAVAGGNLGPEEPLAELAVRFRARPLRVLDFALLNHVVEPEFVHGMFSDSVVYLLFFHPLTLLLDL
jgi:hypothetical protein